MLHPALKICLCTALLAAPMAGPGHAAEPRARTGQAIILGPDDVIRVAEMTRLQYARALSASARQFSRRTAETVYFASGSSRLVRDARSALAGQAAWLMDNPRARFTVTGYTDRAGDAAMNRALGLARARAVARFLVERGVDREQLVGISSHGEEKSDGADPGASRRAVTRIVELRDPQPRGGGRIASPPASKAPSGSGSPASGGGTEGSGTSDGGTGSSGGSTGGTGAASGGNNGKAHGVNGTQPGRNR